MRWQGREKSQNVDDRRRKGGAVRTGGKIGIGTLLFAFVIFLMGGNPLNFLQQQASGGGGASVATAPTAVNAEEEELAQILKVVLKDTEDVWNTLFPKQLKKQYQEPVLVLFSRQTESACGYASSATGPFYCPADQQIYIDLDFNRELSRMTGQKSDFAMAYVLAHEVAHHVQSLLGISGQVAQQKRRVSKTESNQLSVRLELQADFLAGVWAHHTQKWKQVMDVGDLEEAIRAAQAIGDDRLQKQAQGFVVPDSFTHGTSAQRMKWFKMGFETGDLSKGDTFAIPYGQL